MRLLSALLITTAASGPAFALSGVDFSHCASALDDLSTDADDAASKSREAESAEEQFTSEKEEYDRCRRFPDVYDLLQDGCRNKRRDAENARDELESAIGDLKSALDELDGSMGDVQSACGYSLVPTTPVTGISPARQGICTKLRRLKASMKPQELSDLCKRVMTEAECGACLNGR